MPYLGRLHRRSCRVSMHVLAPRGVCRGSATTSVQCSTMSCSLHVLCTNLLFCVFAQVCSELQTSRHFYTGISERPSAYKTGSPLHSSESRQLLIGQRGGDLDKHNYCHDIVMLLVLPKRYHRSQDITVHYTSPSERTDSPQPPIQAPAMFPGRKRGCDCEGL